MLSALFICPKQNKTLKYLFTHRRCITFKTIGLPESQYLQWRTTPKFVPCGPFPVNIWISPRRHATNDSYLEHYVSVHESKKSSAMYEAASMGVARLKADQINILRKQYDAFLEEDKKRKERNECILEKLDQMRLSNTVARYKSNIYLDHRVCDAGAPNAYTHPQANNATKQQSSANSISKYKEALIPTEIDVLPKTLDEKYLINEISKKFILIPKLRSFVSEDYIPRPITQDNNNDSDWKSKYSILDKLKQNEKGEMGYSALNARNENLDQTPSKEPKFGIDEKEYEDDMYSEQYASKPENNIVHLIDKGKTKVSFTTFDAKEEGIAETEKRSHTCAKLSLNNPGSLKSDAENNDRDENIHNNSKVLTEGQHRLQPDQGKAASEMTTSEYTYPIRNDHEHGSAVLKNIDDQHNEPQYDDKHENEVSEKVSLGEDINHVKVVNTMKAAVQKTANENHNMGTPETVEYPTENFYVQDLTAAQDVALADGMNIHPEGYGEHQAYVAPSDQYVSEPAAEFEQVYKKGEQPIGDQYVAEQTASAEQVYLPGVNQPQGNDHYIPEPTSAEQAYMPGTEQGGDQQYVSEPTVAKQVYASGDNTQISENQHVSEPAAADTEQKDYTIENEGYQTTSEQTHDLPLDTVTSEIAEFEAEQSQMFYSEQANYEDYNQAGEGGEYNPDGTGYDPALYYKQQEAANPVEINEHEETSTRYDQSYEQQYAGHGAEQEYAEQQQYGEQYGDQQHYDEQQYAEQQYGEQQPSELGETMYVYDQVTSETEKPIAEQVQQELDNEDFNVRNETATGDAVEESAVYMQNPGDVASTETYGEKQESPQKVS